MRRIISRTAVFRASPFVWYALLSAAYVVLELALPPSSPTVQDYGLSDSSYRILALVVTLPLLFVWFSGFYGYSKLNKYAHSVKKASEGEAFGRMSSGLRLIAWGMPAVAIITTLFSGIAHTHQAFRPTAVIISHYVVLALALGAFTLINSGSQSLLILTNRRPSAVGFRWLAGTFIVLAVIYGYTTVRTVQLHNPHPFQLPMWLILLTIIAPYLYAWFMGVLTILEMNIYRKIARGLFYKHALNLFVAGVSMIILAAIGIEYLTSTTEHLRRIHFDWRLLQLYAAYTLYAVGFTLVATGSQKLQKLEEI